MTETAPQAAAGLSPFRLFAGHPPALRLLFFTELWERFSYYGMRALLVLYLTKHLGFADGQATALYGAYTALVYIGPVLGGLLADRILGPRRAVAAGGILIAAGHFTLAFSHLSAGEDLRAGQGLGLFYLALALIIAGEAFFKVNISTLVGRLYEPGDKRRDAGFTLFYMGINLGAFAAIALCGWLGESVDWGYGFGVAGIGMLIGLAVFLRGSRRLGGIGEAPDLARLHRPLLPGLTAEWAVYAGGIGLTALAYVLVQTPGIVGGLLGVIGLAGMAGLLIFAVATLDRAARDRIFVLVALGVFTIVFWALFEQGGSSLTLFADRNIERHVLGVEINASQLQNLNALFILLLAPFASRLWLGLERKGKDLSTPMKFALGLALLGAGFAALVMGSAYAMHGGRIDLYWLVIAYFLHTAGELCLSPIGLSMVTKLSPRNIVGGVMGLWFLAMAAGQFLAGQFAGLASVAVAKDGGFDRVASLHGYANLYGVLALIAFFAALLLVGLRGLMEPRMHGAD